MPELPDLRFARIFSLVFVVLLTGLSPGFPLSAPSAAELEQPEVESSGKASAFASSRLIADTDKVREGETIAYTLTVRYDGIETTKPITVVFRLPDPAMLVFSSPPMVLGEEYHRELTWKGEISQGQSIEFIITLVTIPDSASSGLLIASAGIIWRPQGMEWQTDSHWLQNETEISSKPGRILYVLPNGIGAGKVEIVLLGYLLLGPLVIFLIPAMILQREKRLRATEQEGAQADEKIKKPFLLLMSFAFVCTIGIAHLMVSIALEDVRRFVAYEKASCILLDKRIVLQKGQSGGQSRKTTHSKPLVAVRYLADGREIIAVGPPRPTSMLSTMGIFALRELAQYERSQVCPCWYDPKVPETFVMGRGISLGWYLLGTGPMILLFFLGRHFLRRLSKDGL